MMFNLVMTSFILIVKTTSGNLPPVFIQNIDLSVVSENTPVGTNIYQLKATDPENSRLTFGIEGTSLLRVDARTGVVSVNQPIDREKLGDSIRFFVTLEDYVGGTTGTNENNIVKVPVTVLILDQNDNRPKFSYDGKNITGIDERIGLKISVSEEASIGSVIFKKIQVTDPDLVGSLLKVTCDGCNDKFRIVTSDSDERRIKNVLNNPNGGVDDDIIELSPFYASTEYPYSSESSSSSSTNYLSFSIVTSKELEFKMKSNIETFTLTATDGSHNTSIPVTIVIEDVQNKSPVFVGSSSAIISEDSPIGSVVMRIRAIDGDAMSTDALLIHTSSSSSSASSVSSKLPDVGRPIFYELLTNPLEYFTLNSRTGDLKVANRLDKESFPSTNGMINIKVKATEIDTKTGKPDTSTPLASSITSLTITLQDVNDEPPKANRDEFFVSVFEGVPNVSIR